MIICKTCGNPVMSEVVNKRSLATHVSINMHGHVTVYYHVKDGQIARYRVKDDKWVMASDSVHLHTLTPISEVSGI